MTTPRKFAQNIKDFYTVRTPNENILDFALQKIIEVILTGDSHDKRLAVRALRNLKQEHPELEYFNLDLRNRPWKQLLLANSNS